jgi:hypothetical protein
MVRQLFQLSPSNHFWKSRGLSKASMMDRAGFVERGFAGALVDVALAWLAIIRPIPPPPRMQDDGQRETSATLHLPARHGRAKG